MYNHSTFGYRFQKPYFITVLTVHGLVWLTFMDVWLLCETVQGQPRFGSLPLIAAASVFNLGQ